MVRSRGSEAPTCILRPVALGELTNEQRRGAACIACGLPVWTAGAVDLGEHQDPDGVRVFPRAHADCLPGGAS
jgi:hypothetical protein